MAASLSASVPSTAASVDAASVAAAASVDAAVVSAVLLPHPAKREAVMAATHTNVVIFFMLFFLLNRNIVTNHKRKGKVGRKNKNVHTFGTVNPRDPEPIFPVPQSGRSPGSQFKHPLLPSR